MFFILSKILVYFVFPLSWVLILLVFWFFSKSPKRKKRFGIAALIIFTLFSNPFLMNRFAGWWDAAPVTIPKGQTYSCAIVLGGFTSSDKNDSGYFNMSADRFLQGIMLYRLGTVNHILVTGGSGRLIKGSFSEGKWAYQSLKEMGIPDSAIIIEGESRNTLENAVYSKRVLDSAGLKEPYLLVTSAFHMRRSLWTFKNQGVNVVAYPCNYMAGMGNFNFDELLPRAFVLDAWSAYFKEMAGCIAYYFKSKN